MSADLDEFFARARAAADSLDAPLAAQARRRGDQRRHRRMALVAVAVFALVAATLGTVTLTTRHHSHPTPATSPSPAAFPSGFAPLHRVGTALDFGSAGRASTGLTLAYGDSVYAAWQTRNQDSLLLARTDLRADAAKRWGPQKISMVGEWQGLALAPDADVLVATVLANEGVAHPERQYLFDASSGRPLWHTGAATTYFITGDVLVAKEGSRLVGRDLRTGRRLWQQTVPQRLAVTAASATEQPSIAGGPRVLSAGDIATLDEEGVLDVFDAHKGSIGLAGTRGFAPGSRLVGGIRAEVYVASPPGKPLTIQGVNAHGGRTVYSGQATSDQYLAVTACFDTLLCFPEGQSLVAVDPSPQQPVVAWRSALSFAPTGVLGQVGAGFILVGPSFGDDEPYVLLDRDGRIVRRLPVTRAPHLDSLHDGVLLGPNGGYARSQPLPISVVTRDGATASLGQISAGGFCSATDDLLACLDDTGVALWSFR
ncbi:outer membrane protein assembly factor BamB family protein [Hamadaea tsunoensis]|uniref:outer membrane protein assembly factor BamB family protein n=1 Tax=Hamadaea tsunoensis TaxID=53368 RepID=UPI00042A47F4|nr:PQQ-binding-like beta-propeller repeat protein [Hamadaea tsunoensis]